jgi:hypothetical protein
VWPKGESGIPFPFTKHNFPYEEIPPSSRGSLSVATRAAARVAAAAARVAAAAAGAAAAAPAATGIAAAAAAAALAAALLAAAAAAALLAATTAALAATAATAAAFLAPARRGGGGRVAAARAARRGAALAGIRVRGEERLGELFEEARLERKLPARDPGQRDAEEVLRAGRNGSGWRGGAAGGGPRK